MNNYKFNKKISPGCLEYELVFPKFGLGYCGINVYTTHNIESSENLYFSLYNYFMFAVNLMNCQILIENNFDKTVNNLKEKFLEFGKKNMNNFYEFDFSELLKNFIKKNKTGLGGLGLKEISKTYGYFEMNFSDNTKNQIISYINSNNTFKEKAFVIRFIIQQKSFILRFVGSV